MGESGAFNIFINYEWVGISAIGIFWAILFLQSGFDKVFDWKGNLEWLKGHFSKSPLASFVAPMLGVLTVIEILAGLSSAIGVIAFWSYEIQFYICLLYTSPSPRD